MLRQKEKEEDKILSIKRTGKNFDKRFIRRIVSLVEEGCPRQELGKTYNIKPVTLDQWLQRYGSEEYHAQKRRSYSKLQKRTIVAAIEEGRMTIQEAKSAYQIKSIKLIHDWIRQFKAEKIDLCKLKTSLMASPVKITGSEETKALQKALEEAQMKITALNTMIDVAEEQLKINIRKKSGAKQS